jgi:hypothetical protein
MTEVRDDLPRRAKAPGLDRLKAELERIVQPRQLGLGHLVIAIREDQIDVPLGQARRCIAGDAAILDVDADRFHSSKPTLLDASSDPIDEGARPIILRGKRPMFEMDQVIPGADPDDFDSDPIIEASERGEAGDPVGAREILMKLLAEDLRCLDAHAHLGNLEFKYGAKQALRHYEIGVAIGTLSLGTSFDGVLPWGLIDNRPFLRCLHGGAIRTHGPSCAFPSAISSR